MILAWSFIGIIAGLVLGITGSGGAIIAVPLFIHLLGFGFREATALSLVTVVLGSVFNGWFQRRSSNLRVGLLLFLFSIFGGIVARPWKTQLPLWSLKAIFISVCAYSLITIWKHRKLKFSLKELDTNRLSFSFVLKTLLGGFVIGILITLTGLGGGVMIVTYLQRCFRLEIKKAAATSLLCVALSASFSLWNQRHLISFSHQTKPLLVLLCGSLLSAVITRFLLKRLPEKQFDRIRVLLLTSVITISILGVF